jgi:ADP-ribose pyrophosphatase YjhB (NUDIX family)
MKFCSNCGHAVEFRIPDGDQLPRHVCPSCGTIHYKNPLIVAGCVPVFEGRILMCRRAIEPRKGYWTFPAGFMENGETTQQAAQREAIEEALATVEIGSLLSIVHVLHADQVHITFRARLARRDFGVGAESVEVVLCEEDELPWDSIAFASVDFALRRYIEDRRRGVEDHHFTTIDLRRTLKR